MKTQPKKGFTLIEILIVVVILGVLAAIVIPAYAGSTDDSAQQAFIASIRKIADIATYHYQLTGEYFENSTCGQMPAGMDNYMRESVWIQNTPIGGKWNFDRDSYGFRSSFGVHFHDGAPQSEAYMLEIDTAFDDGDLTTGSFRKLADDRYYYIVAN